MVRYDYIQVTKTSVAAKGDVPKVAAATPEPAAGGLGYAGILMIVFLSLISLLIGLACNKVRRALWLSECVM